MTKLTSMWGFFLTWKTIRHRISSTGSKYMEDAAMRRWGTGLFPARKTAVAPSERECSPGAAFFLGLSPFAQSLMSKRSRLISGETL